MYHTSRCFLYFPLPVFLSTAYRQLVLLVASSSLLSCKADASNVEKHHTCTTGSLGLLSVCILSKKSIRAQRIATQPSSPHRPSRLQSAPKHLLRPDGSPRTYVPATTAPSAHLYGFQHDPRCPPCIAWELSLNACMDSFYVCLSVIITRTVIILA